MIGSILTVGLGSFSSVGYILTMGFGDFDEPTPPTGGVARLIGRGGGLVG